MQLRPSITPYNYVQNNPLNRFDPDGRVDKSAAFWALSRGVLGGLGYAGGWAMQIKGVAILAGSGGTLSPVGLGLVFGGEGLKGWSAFEMASAVGNLKFALSVPDGTDAEAIGNLAYEISKELGATESKSQILAFLGDALTGGKGMVSNLKSGKGLDILKSLLADAGLTKDVKDILETIVQEQQYQQQSIDQQSSNNSNNDSNDDNNEEETDNSWWDNFDPSKN